MSRERAISGGTSAARARTPSSVAKKSRTLCAGGGTSRLRVAFGAPGWPTPMPMGRPIRHASAEGATLRVFNGAPSHRAQSGGAVSGRPPRRIGRKMRRLQCSATAGGNSAVTVCVTRSRTVIQTAWAAWCSMNRSASRTSAASPVLRIAFRSDRFYAQCIGPAWGCGGVLAYEFVVARFVHTPRPSAFA
jgi:hypothetical protein